MASSLELYDPLDIIGNGSFGIIRKVRRKTDGMIFARKELNFERMTERDRKQIVAEVNILKDLHHEHIVRYHDRDVDREAGILYILMEYCGGGDLSTVIKQAVKQNRSIPEDTIWSYFMQILLALQHCHHPNGHGRSSSGGSDDDKERRPQILHRDLKPDNVFLSESNTVKLGDFGLSKAMAQASFANTYVGTPYYMSPELMQEKAYDSKSDIWSLGCLIYELCALKPPFHDAKTHTELSVFIRNGRIPPLPRGYSQALSNAIKAMLNLNPAMRPSAAQLLQLDRIGLAYKVCDTERMIAEVKIRKANAAVRERELTAREANIAEREARLAAIVAEKDAEISSLKSILARTETMVAETLEARVREAVGKREEELRALVMKREQEVAASMAASMAKREEEIVCAIGKRQEEINDIWRVREREVRDEVAHAVEERMQWITAHAEELKQERDRLDAIRTELESKLKALGEKTNVEKKGRKDKTPFEEVKNILAPLTRLTEIDECTPLRDSSRHNIPAFETPINQATRDIPPSALLNNLGAVGSAMKGVILTETGQPIHTPTPAELAKLFVASPKVGLNFVRIFDPESDSESEDDNGDDDHDTEDELHSSPSRRQSARRESTPRLSGSGETELASSAATVVPTRLRRPSMRPLRPSLPSLATDTSSNSSTSSSHTTSASTSDPSSMSANKEPTEGHLASRSSPPMYNFSDEENLPSPFLRRAEKERAAMSKVVSSSATVKIKSKRPSNANLLRAVAAANSANAGKRNGGNASLKVPSGGLANARPSVASARKAGEEARRALHRS